MIVLLNEQVKLGIKTHAERVKPAEACGCIIKVLDNPVIYPCENVSGRPASTFRISPESYLKAESMGEVLAIYHSHLKNRSPSGFDIQASAGHRIPYVVYNVPGDVFCVADGPRLLDFMSRDFEIGVNDCFSLVRDFYRKFLGVEISNYDREEGWHERNPRMFLDNFVKEGFRETDKLEENCLLLLKTSHHAEFPHHLGIYLGDDTMFHHPREKRPLIEPYPGRWEEATVMKLVHEKA